MAENNYKRVQYLITTNPECKEVYTEMQDHNFTSSFETNKSFKKMDNKLDNLKKDLDDFKTDSRKDFNEFKLAIVKEIAELPGKLENKFAPKWVADALKFVIGAIIVGFIGSVLTLILK